MLSAYLPGIFPSAVSSNVLPDGSSMAFFWSFPLDILPAGSLRASPPVISADMCIAAKQKKVLSTQKHSVLFRLVDLRKISCNLMEITILLLSSSDAKADMTQRTICTEAPQEVVTVLVPVFTLVFLPLLWLFA